MIIYCAGPIRGDKQYQSFYKEIIKYVNSLGHTALSELNEKFKSAFPLNDVQIFKRDVKWMEKSKFVIAETTASSTGVGFEIAYSLYNLNKPVLALVKKGEKSVSAMVSGCNSEILDVKAYSSSEEMKKIIARYINELENN
ncbi:MAG: nucleoside 2-deoxyribosyltransferase [Ignavibacteriaceae bacterium]